MPAKSYFLMSDNSTYIYIYIYIYIYALSVRFMDSKSCKDTNHQVLIQFQRH